MNIHKKRLNVDEYLLLDLGYFQHTDAECEGKEEQQEVLEW